jgi:hypothetical protein
MRYSRNIAHINLNAEELVVVRVGSPRRSEISAKFEPDCILFHFLAELDKRSFIYQNVLPPLVVKVNRLNWVKGPALHLEFFDEALVPVRFLRNVDSLVVVDQLQFWLAQIFDRSFE